MWCEGGGGGGIFKSKFYENIKSQINYKKEQIIHLFTFLGVRFFSQLYFETVIFMNKERIESGLGITNKKVKKKYICHKKKIVFYPFSFLSFLVFI